MSETEILGAFAALASKIGKRFNYEQVLADFNRLIKKMAFDVTLGAEMVSTSAMRSMKSKVTVPAIDVMATAARR